MTEAFKRGYLDKMAELRKRAQEDTDEKTQVSDIDTAEESAGIGSLYDNGATRPGGVSKVHPGSYIGRLAAKFDGSKGGDITVYPRILDRNLYDDELGINDVTMDQLSDARHQQARDFATSLYPLFSAPYRRIVDNLKAEGEKNYQEYLRTGNTPVRTEPNLEGKEDLDLTPEQKEWLKEQQNIQVRNRRPAGAPVVA